MMKAAARPLSQEAPDGGRIWLDRLNDLNLDPRRELDMQNRDTRPCVDSAKNRPPTEKPDVNRQRVANRRDRMRDMVIHSANRLQ
jgi:hypothetical protein